MGNTKLMKLGELSFDKDCGIPVLEVLVDGEIYGYLTPFRGYYFQVSKTYEGVHGLGRSSNGYNLKELLIGRELCDKTTFKGLAYLALLDSASTWKVYNKEDTSDIAFVYPTKETQFDRFIEESVTWVKERA